MYDVMILREQKENPGFSLIELLVVVVAIVILSVAATVFYNSFFDKAEYAGGVLFEKLQNDALRVSLIGEWKFDETSGTTAIDTSRRHNDGTKHGTMTPMPATSCVHQGCYDFNSNACSYVDFTTSKIDYPFTVSVWIKNNGKLSSDRGCADNNEDQVIISIANEQEDNFYGGLYIGSNSVDNLGSQLVEPETVILRSRNGANQYNTWGSTIVTDGVWHHVAGVWNNRTDRQIYIDGKKQDDGYVTNAPVDFPNADLRWNIGRWADVTPKSYYKGLIDDVRIFDDVMNKVAIEKLYKEGLKTHPVALSQ